MELIQQTPDLSAYLAADEAIDHHHPVVRETAARLAERAADSYAYARAAYEFVRDTIPHSADSGDPRVTWRASDVIEQRTGICHAKAHALAALLRAEDIPTALCYQRLLHQTAAMSCTVWSPCGSTAPGTGRTRAGTSRASSPLLPPWERLAWVPDKKSNEADYPVLYAVPHPVVLSALEAARDRPALWKTLPTAL